MCATPQWVCGFVSDVQMTQDGDHATTQLVSRGLVYAAEVLSAEFYQKKTSPNLEPHTEQSILATIHTYGKTFQQQNLIYVS